MKKFSVFMVVILLSLAIFSQNLKPVDEGSMIKFLIKNFGITVTGTFTGLQGNIVFNPNYLSTSYFKVSVDASTIHTGVAKRDRDLKKENYFDVDKHPRLSFVSVKITSGPQPSMYLVNGNITIKGVTKSISFPFKAAARKDGYLFSGEFDLNRRDFRIGGNSLILSDDLHVVLAINGKKE